MVSRRGRQLDLPGVVGIGADAVDAARMAELAHGAAAVFNCANPAYHRWPSDWPPIAAALLDAAEASGAVLVTTSNSTPTGKNPTGPMMPNDRAPTTRRRRSEPACGTRRPRRTPRGPDPAPPRCGPPSTSVRVPRASRNGPPRLLVGGAARGIRSLSTLRTVGLTRATPRARSWPRPTSPSRGAGPGHPDEPPRIPARAVADLARRRRSGRPRVAPHSDDVLAALGLVDPPCAELRYTMYQFEAPFVIDDSTTRSELGLAPTPWSEVLATTVSAARVRLDA